MSTSAISASLRASACSFLAFPGLDDADHVDGSLAACVLYAMRRDDPEREIVGIQSKECRTELVTILAVHRQAEAAARGQHEKCDRMQRDNRSRRQHGALDTLLSAAIDERADVGELSELRLVDP
jgi:hypothetical protein